MAISAEPRSDAMLPTHGKLSLRLGTRFVQVVAARGYTDAYRAQHHSLKDRSYLNVVAQEFQAVFPEDVQSSGEKLPSGDPILQVDTYPLTIYSAAAIQELNQKLTRELKRRDAENAELKQRLERLEQLINSKQKSL